MHAQSCSTENADCSGCTALLDVCLKPHTSIHNCPSGFFLVLMCYGNGGPTLVEIGLTSTTRTWASWYCSPHALQRPQPQLPRFHLRIPNFVMQCPLIQRRRMPVWQQYCTARFKHAHWKGKMRMRAIQEVKQGAPSSPAPAAAVPPVHVTATNMHENEAAMPMWKDCRSSVISPRPLKPLKDDRSAAC